MQDPGPDLKVLTANGSHDDDDCKNCNAFEYVSVASWPVLAAGTADHAGIKIASPEYALSKHGKDRN